MFMKDTALFFFFTTFLLHSGIEDMPALINKLESVFCLFSKINCEDLLLSPLNI